MTKSEIAQKIRELLDNSFDNLIEATLELADLVEEDDDDEYVEEEDFEIRVKTFPFKPMTAEEAILQMNLIGHTFYAFTDADSGDVCVVYKRKAGSYGLIVPEK
jgi:putative sigma-54 modulation protein